MLARNDACLDVISGTSLQFEILGRRRIGGRGKDVLAWVCMIDEVGSILQRADVYPIVFNIDPYGRCSLIFW